MAQAGGAGLPAAWWAQERKGKESAAYRRNESAFTAGDHAPEISSCWTRAIVPHRITPLAPKHLKSEPGQLRVGECRHGVGLEDLGQERVSLLVVELRAFDQTAGPIGEPPVFVHR